MTKNTDTVQNAFMFSIFKDAPKAEPSPLADSVTVKAGIVAVKQWMAEGKAKG